MHLNTFRYSFWWHKKFSFQRVFVKVSLICTFPGHLQYGIKIIQLAKIYFHQNILQSNIDDTKIFRIHNPTPIITLRIVRPSVMFFFTKYNPYMTLGKGTKKALFRRPPKYALELWDYLKYMFSPCIFTLHLMILMI